MLTLLRREHESSRARVSRGRLAFVKVHRAMIALFLQIASHDENSTTSGRRSKTAKARPELPLIAMRGSDQFVDKKVRISPVGVLRSGVCRPMRGVALFATSRCGLFTT